LSGQHPPLTCKEVKQALALLGFQPQPQKGTSHEHYTGIFRGKFRKVTVDCPKAPFSPILISSMANQAGLSKKELYAAVRGQRPTNWP
jgi:predicted RNA binding protein YcfA (HicA-like mRNA interferase family)